MLILQTNKGERETAVPTTTKNSHVEQNYARYYPSDKQRRERETAVPTTTKNSHFEQNHARC